MTEITSRIFIEATVTTESGEAVVTIRDSHTNIVRITVNGETVLSKEEETAGEYGDKATDPPHTLEQRPEYIDTVDVEEIRSSGMPSMNYELFEEGLEQPADHLRPLPVKEERRRDHLEG